jgi:hypothetical protein
MSEVTVHKPALVVIGVFVGLAGLLFTVQGVGLIKGSSMSDTTFWTVAGPVIIAVGLVVAGIGVRGRGR